MAEPIVFDARRELSFAALQALMRADRVIVSIKDQRTAVLGCWWHDAEREPLEQLGVLVLTLNLGRDPKDTSSHPVESPRVCGDIQQAQDNPHWQRILSMLRPGDRLGVGRESASAHYQLELWLENRRLANFPLLSFAVHRTRSRPRPSAQVVGE